MRQRNPTIFDLRCVTALTHLLPISHQESLFIFCLDSVKIVRSQVEEGNHGRIVAIDIETGAFEVADDSLTAAKQLLIRFPDAQIFGIRIGHRAVHRFGFRSPSVSP